MRAILKTAAIVFFTISFSLFAEDNGDKTGEEINWQVISSGGTDGDSENFGLKGTAGLEAQPTAPVTTSIAVP